MNFLNIIGATALTYYVLLFFGIDSPLKIVADLEITLINLIRPVTPFLMFIILFTWFIKPILSKVMKSIFSNIKKIDFINRQKIDFNLIIRHSYKIALLISLISSIFPRAPGVNPENLPIGVDSQKYKNSVTSVEDLSQIIGFGERIVVRTILFTLHRVFGLSIDFSVDCLPILLNLLLVVSVHHFVYCASGDRELAGLSALNMTFSYTVIVGYFSYYLSNNLAIVFMLMSFSYVIKNIKDNEESLNIKSLLFGALLILTHQWTFMQYYGILIFFLLFLLYKERDLSKLSPLILYVIFLGFTYYANKIFLSNFQPFYETGVISSSYFRPLDFFNNNLFIFNTLYQGLMGNAVYLLIPLIGIISLNKDKELDIFLYVFVLITSIVYVYSNMNFPTLKPTNIIPSRLLYNIPLCIVAAKGIMHLVYKRFLPLNLTYKIVNFYHILMTVYLFRSLYQMVGPA